MNKRRRVLIFSLMFVMIGIACMCSNPGQILTPTTVAQPTSATRPTQAAQPTQAVPSNSIPTQESQAALPPVKITGNIITDIIFAENVAGNTKEPVNPTNVFTPDATIHAVVKIKGAPANTRIKGSWYVVDVGSAASPGSVIDATDVTTDGTRNIDFTLAPDKNWPAGTYRIEVLINDSKEGEAYYRVSGSVSQNQNQTQPAATYARCTNNLTSQIVMAEDVQGDKLDPVNPTMEFTPTSKIHAVVTAKSAPANTKFKITWTVNDIGKPDQAGYVIGTYEMTAQGSRNLDFSLSPDNQWVVGTYKAELTVNGDPGCEAVYSVK